MTQIIQPKYFQEIPIDFLIGGKVYVYDAGTSTPRKSYPTVKDAEAETNPNTNPVILDSRGEARLVIKGATKLVLKDSSNNLIWTVDDLDRPEDADIVDSNSNELLIFTETADAVNNFNIRNSSAPRLSAEGSDINIGIKITTKGNGQVYIEPNDLNVQSGITISTGDLNIIGGDLNTLDLYVESISLGSSLVTSIVPPGVVAWYGGSSAPSNWLECNGAAVSRTTYSDLFDTIGTTFGVGDGSTTFNLPNQARRTLVGKGGTGTGTLGNTIGSTGGSETHTLTVAELAAHTHNCPVRSNTPVTTSTLFARAPLPPDTLSPTPTTSTGGGSAHNIVQPSLVLMMMIKT